MRTHLLVALVAFGLGVVAAMLLGRGGGTAGGAEARAPEPPPASLATEVRLRESEARNERLEAKIEALERAQAAAVAGGGRDAQEPGTDVQGAGEEARRGPRFVFPGAELGLIAVDWHVTGNAMAKLMPLLSEAADVAHGRREMRAALWGDILQQFGPIVTEAIKLEGAGGSWSSPSFLANLVHATLAEAGEPLDAEQEEALEAIGLRHLDEDGQRRTRFGEATPLLRQRIEEARGQDRFFAEVEPILRDAQRAVLYPPGVRGVTGLDVFSGANVWDEHLARLKHTDRAGLRAAATAAHTKDLGLRAELLTHLEGVVGERERGLPDGFVFHEADAAARDDVKMEPYDRVMLAADRQLALYEALLARAPLLDAEKERILAHEQVLVPLLGK